MAAGSSSGVAVDALDEAMIMLAHELNLLAHLRTTPAVLPSPSPPALHHPPPEQAPTSLTPAATPAHEDGCGASRPSSQAEWLASSPQFVTIFRFVEGVIAETVSSLAPSKPQPSPSPQPSQLPAAHHLPSRPTSRAPSAVAAVKEEVQVEGGSALWASDRAGSPDDLAAQGGPHVGAGDTGVEEGALREGEDAECWREGVAGKGEAAVGPDEAAMEDAATQVSDQRAQDDIDMAALDISDNADWGPPLRFEDIGVDDVRRQAALLGMVPERDWALMWVARLALLTAVPPEWEEHRDRSGQPYFFNCATLATSRTHPLRQMFQDLVVVLRSNMGDVQGMPIPVRWYANTPNLKPELIRVANMAPWLDLYDREQGRLFYYNWLTAERSDHMPDQVLHRAAARIQSLYRGHVGRLIARLMREEEEVFRVHVAAVDIQRTFRGWRGRRRAAEERRREMDNWAAARIQHSWRRHRRRADHQRAALPRPAASDLHLQGGADTPPIPNRSRQASLAHDASAPAHEVPESLEASLSSDTEVSAEHKRHDAGPAVARPAAEEAAASSSGVDDAPSGEGRRRRHRRPFQKEYRPLRPKRTGAGHSADVRNKQPRDTNSARDHAYEDAKRRFDAAYRARRAETEAVREQLAALRETLARVQKEWAHLPREERTDAHMRALMFKLTTIRRDIADLTAEAAEEGGDARDAPRTSWKNNMSPRHKSARSTQSKHHADNMAQGTAAMGESTATTAACGWSSLPAEPFLPRLNATPPYSNVAPPPSVPPPTSFPSDSASAMNDSRPPPARPFCTSPQSLSRSHPHPDPATSAADRQRLPDPLLLTSVSFPATHTRRNNKAASASPRSKRVHMSLNNYMRMPPIRLNQHPPYDHTILSFPPNLVAPIAPKVARAAR